MVWLATDACNARCLHCSSNSSRRNPRELSTSEVVSLFDQFAGCGVVDVAISGGEPLLRRDVFEVLEHVRSLGLAFGLGSNGSTLTQDSARRLARLGVNRYQVSLDGLRTSHDALRVWPGLFDRAIATIALARTAGLRTHVCCTINRLNAGELCEFTAFVAGLDVQRINFSRYVPTGRGTESLDLSNDDWQVVIKECMRLRHQYAGRMEITTHLAQQILVDCEVARMPAFVGCQAGIGQGCVTADGTVWPCVLLPIPLGNIRERGFQEIWNESEVIHTLRARTSLTGACAHCDVKDRCGGCRAVAYAKTGDYLATDPRCWLPGASPERLALMPDGGHNGKANDESGG